MSPINLHDSVLATAVIRAGTLQELGERDNIERAGPVLLMLANFPIKITNECEKN